METVPPVRCPANEAVALYLFNKRQELAARSTGLSENLDKTLSRAYASICASKTPIKTLKDLSKIKGVRKWILTLMKGCFSEEPSPSSDAPSKDASPQKEILEGFDVQRTTGFADTVRRYGHLTKSIIEYYSASFSGNVIKYGKSDSKLCPSFQEFVRRCQDMEKMTVSDVFALQLMQVPQVIEEVALAVVEVYPTLFSLAKAYSVLEGNVLAQEEMLKNKCKAVSSSASRNIFKLVWST